MTKYLDIAIKAANYIDQFKIKTDNGTYWDINSSFKGAWKYYDNISLYTGSAGIIKFLLTLYHSTGEKKYLETANDAGNYLIYRWRNNKSMQKAFSPYAFTTGFSGVGFILDELSRSSSNTQYLKTVEDIANKIINSINKKGYWSGQTGIVADSGTVLFLLSIVKRYKIPGIREAIVSFGDYLISTQHNDKYGKYYVGLDLKYVGGPIGKFNTGFPLGPSGCAFTLLKIYEYTGEKRFLEATRGVKEFYENFSLKNNSILVPHYLPDDTHICYIGYCGGPVGISRFFYEYYKQLKNLNYLKDLKKTIKALSSLGVPEQRSKGYWQVDNYCCGTAGVLQLYIGAYLEFGNKSYLSLAKKTADILIDRSVSDEKSAKWIQAFERKVPENLTAALGYYDGAAGIATSLVQFDQILNDNFLYHRFIDDPYPEKKQGSVM